MSFSPDIIHHIIESNELSFSVGQGRHFQNQHGLIRLTRKCAKDWIYTQKIHLGRVVLNLPVECIVLMKCNMIYNYTFTFTLVFCFKTPLYSMTKSQFDYNLCTVFITFFPHSHDYNLKKMFFCHFAQTSVWCLVVVKMLNSRFYSVLLFLFIVLTSHCELRKSVDLNEGDGDSLGWCFRNVGRVKLLYNV